MLDMIKKVVIKIKAEIETERKNREASEANLLGLLESICTKLHTTS